MGFGQTIVLKQATKGNGSWTFNYPGKKLYKNLFTPKPIGIDARKLQRGNALPYSLNATLSKLLSVCIHQ